MDLLLQPCAQVAVRARNSILVSRDRSNCWHILTAAVDQAVAQLFARDPVNASTFLHASLPQYPMYHAALVPHTSISSGCDVSLLLILDVLLILVADILRHSPYTPYIPLEPHSHILIASLASLASLSFPSLTPHVSMFQAVS